MENFVLPTFAMFSKISFGDLLMAASRFEVQIVLVIFHTIFWYFIINRIFYPFVIRAICGLECKKQFIEFNRQSFKKLMLWDIGDVEEEQIETIASIDAVVLQHLIGGMLCLPSALGLASFFPPGMASAMACHGGLSEIGYEIEDIMVRLYEILYGGEKGRRKNPSSVLFGLFAHHSAACCLVVPCNIFYRDNSYIHEAICCLQLAAFGAFYLQQYGYTLDVKKQHELTKMKISITLSLVVILWTRIIRYGMLWNIVLNQILEDQNWVMLKCCILPLILLTFFNVGVLIDATAKFMKFIPMTVKKDSKNVRENEESKSDLLLGLRLFDLILITSFFTKGTSNLMNKIVDWCGIQIIKKEKKID